MKRTAWALIGAAGMTIAGIGGALADEQDWGPYQVGETRSGYTYAAEETRKMQDDEFENPGFIWNDYGGELWKNVEGSEGKACASCHDSAEESMKGVGARYPVYSEKLGKLVNLEQQINLCRENQMGAEPWKWESRELLGMTTFVRHQSLGMPVEVKIEGPAAPFYEKGKEFYYTRRGQLDMACSNCHEDNAGNMIRANLLSQGQSNGFPTYRLKWQGVGSLHRRFRGCNSQVRAEKLPFGTDDYVNLELFLAGRAEGLPVETPAVRN
jgi:sulfur-oxidizing protein SoxA